MIQNIHEAIEAVALALGALKDECVLTGGATVGFYLSDSQERVVRGTDDVDVIINVLTRGDYQDRINPLLCSQGFKQLITGEEPLCRWHVEDIVVDIMPVNKSVLGFSNRWYPLGIQTAVDVRISDRCVWKMLNPPCFMATKFEAFNDRGRKDIMSSRDYEDIISLINGRPELLDEISQCEQDLRTYLIESCTSIIEDEECCEAVQFHLAPDAASQRRYDLVLGIMKNISRL